MKKNKHTNNAIVIGGGAFGTAMASLLCQNCEKVFVKVRSPDTFMALQRGENHLYLKGLQLPKNLVPFYSWDDLEGLITEKNIEVILYALPTKTIRNFLSTHKEIIQKFLFTGTPLVSLCKGIDPDTLELPDDLFFDAFSDFRDQFAFLSGPSFASEIVEKQITVTSLAARSRILLEKLSHILETPYFKVTPTYDIKGVLLGGALKNPLAIACGIIEGLGYNNNTRAALITRGMVDMLTIGQIFNARAETFYGPSGAGDLILSTTGQMSRNKKFGLEIARGKRPQEIMKNQRDVVEGYKCTFAVKKIIEKFSLECRIFEGIYDILYNDISPQEIIAGLMDRPFQFQL